jgi:NADH:ubiquinone oxidoreductase subunit 3 (subunit A)
MWAAISFVCLAVNNAFLFADTTLFPDLDLTAYRFSAALLGTVILIFGLVWETE